MNRVLKSEEETFRLGKEIGLRLVSGDMVLLSGDMGAGKTALTKGIASALCVERDVSSPTFNLLNVYSGRLSLYHYDLYRLESIEELEESGLDEYFGSKNGVCVIEWADKFPLRLENLNVYKITLRYIDENTREATIDTFK